MRFLITIAVVLVGLGVPAGFVETTVAGSYARTIDERRSLTDEEASMVTERLDDFQLSTVAVRLNDLERRMLTLEKENKLSEDKIRSLERQVNDLRRRRV